MKIYVRSNFQQQEGDRVLYEFDGLVALEVADETLYEEYRVNLNDDYVEEIEKEIAKKLIEALNELCDSKSRDAKIIIAGMKVSVEKMEEYEMVADAITREDVAWFEDEAAVLGTSAEDEFARAKEAKMGYQFAYDSFKKLIRIYRRWNAQNIQNGEFTLARQKIEEAKEIGVGLEGGPVEILTQSKEQVMKTILEQGESDV